MIAGNPAGVVEHLRTPVSGRRRVRDTAARYLANRCSLRRGGQPEVNLGSTILAIRRGFLGRSLRLKLPIVA